MENLFIQETKYTPQINLDCEKNLIEFRGKSYPENTFEFYKPIMEWIERYFEEQKPVKTVMNIEIIYFNSSSSKLFFDLFDLLEEASKSYEIEANWIYDEENESALEAGEDFVADFESLKINLVAKN